MTGDLRHDGPMPTAALRVAGLRKEYPGHDGRGTVVAAQAQADLDDKRLRLAQDRLAKDLDYYRGLGLSLEELIALVRRHYD